MLEVLAAVAAMGMAPQEMAPRVQDHGPQRVSPRGSYSRSCSGDYVNQGRLYADCRDSRGRIRGTSIQLNRCSDHDIANDNGLLVCGRFRGDYEDRGGSGGGWGGGNNGGWGGGWGGGRSDTITVYRDINFGGPSRVFQGEIDNLQHIGFNDAISSMRFEGEWEACTDAYFRGYCQTFRDDVRNLVSWRMNDSISSLRPLRGNNDRWGNGRGNRRNR